MEQPLLIDERSGVLRVTINRPTEKNALNRATARALAEQLERCSENDQIRVVLVSGSGTSAFCAGADLRELASLNSPEERGAFFREIATLMAAFARCTKPIISKVHGFALAGGCGLVAASDIVLASEDATFGLPEMKVGIAPLMIIAPLARCIGRKALADMMLSAEFLNARRALEIGLISRVEPSSNLDAAADALAERIAGFAPAALVAAKKTLWTAPDQEFFSSLDTLADRIGMLSCSDDAREGINAFLQKRSPTWKI